MFSITARMAIGVLMAGDHRRPRVIFFVRILSKVGKTEPQRLLVVVRPDEALSIPSAVATNAHPVRLGSPGLHAHAGLDA